MPKVSVVVPVYKVEQYLQRCVDSILNQTYSDFQLILVDDGSPDKCPVMCDEYAIKDNRVKVIHRKNGGLSAARNSAIEYILAEAYTTWITFIDSDDWIHRDYLRVLVDGAEKTDTDIAVCLLDTSASEYIPDEAFETQPKAQVWTTEDFFCYERLDANAICARLLKTDLLKEIRFPVGMLHEDRFTSYKIYFQRDKVAVFLDILYYYFVNDESIVHKTWDIKRAEDDFLAARNQLEFFKEYNCNKAYELILRQYVHLILYGLKQSKKQKLHSVHLKLKFKMYSVLCKYKGAYANYDNKKDLKKYTFPILYRLTK